LVKHFSREEPNLKKTTIPIALFVGLLFTSFQSAHAAWPVIDVSAINRLVQQIQEMKKQYDLMKKQYDELVATKEAVTGSYGISLLENGPLAELGRREIPGTWQEVVSLQKSGSIPGFYFDRQDYYIKLLPTVDVNLFSKDSNNRNSISYKISTDNTRASFAATEAIYNKIQDRLKTLEVLTHAIDQTANVKSATDLNSRIAAENGFLNIELARLNSLQLGLQTAMQNNQNQATANHAEFFGEALK
jgi:type IV secretion system protein VirB5